MDRHPAVMIVYLLIFLVSLSAHAQNPKPIDRFFLHGDGRVKIKNLHNGRFVDVKYLNADGSLNELAFPQIDHVFGFPTKLAGENVSRRTVAFLDHFVDQYNPEAIAEMIKDFEEKIDAFFSYIPTIDDGKRLIAKMFR